MRFFKFECEDQYSLVLNICDNENFTGEFTIASNYNNIPTPFSGIGLRLEENIYNLAFVVSWKQALLTDEQYYTAFNGKISLDSNESFCLSLKWLLISESKEGSKSIEKSNGKSILYETAIDPTHNQNGLSLPFPNYEMQFTADN